MKPEPQASTQEVLAGLVERVTYHNAENGFCVLRAKARGRRDVVTVVGHAATFAPSVENCFPTVRDRLTGVTVEQALHKRPQSSVSQQQPLHDVGHVHPPLGVTCYLLP
jgi:hypothetical protein